MFKRFCLACRELASFLWSWFIVWIQTIYGIIRMSAAPRPRVTFFGGARLKLDDKYARAAYDLARKLAESDISILTGGGPGVMEAAACGAQEASDSKGHIIGITVRGIDEHAVKACNSTIIVMEHFFARKWLLTRYSTAFVVFPGGFGTLDEMTEIITLMQTDKLPRLPIVLFGTEYWEYFMKWLNKSALTQGLISQEDINLVVVSDDVDEVFGILSRECLGDQCPII